MADDKRQDWDGLERRGIDFHVLNYIDGKIKDHTDKTNKTVLDETSKIKVMLDTHTSDEMLKYAAIEQAIGAQERRIVAQDAASSVRHEETRGIALRVEDKLEKLQESLDAWTHGHNTALTEIRKAFPKNEEKMPDFDGHRSDHESRMKSAQSWSELGKSIREKLATGAVIGAITIIGYALMDYLKIWMHKP